MVSEAGQKDFKCKAREKSTSAGVRISTLERGDRAQQSS
jgi:hypothetical protein